MLIGEKSVKIVLRSVYGTIDSELRRNGDQTMEINVYRTIICQWNISFQED